MLREGDIEVLTTYREKMVVVLAARRERRAAAKLHEQQMQQAAIHEQQMQQAAKGAKVKGGRGKAKKHKPRVVFGESREGRTSGGGAIAPKHPPPPDDSVAELARLAPVLPGGRRLLASSSYSHDALPPLPPHRCLIFFAEGLFTFGRSFVDAIVSGTSALPRTTLVFTEYLTPSELHKTMALEMCLENVRTIISSSTTSQCECLCRLGVDAAFCRFGLPPGTRLPRSSALFASGVYAIKDPSARGSNAIANTRALMTGMMASSASLQGADDFFYLTFGLSLPEGPHERL